MHINFTPYAVSSTVGRDHKGLEYVLVIAKTSYSFATGSLVQETTSAPLVIEDQMRSDGDIEYVSIESDFCPSKEKVDLVIAGNIRSNTPRKVIDVSLELEGYLSKMMRVVGDRRWMASAYGLHLSEPVSFESMPVSWTRAFGGIDPQRPQRWEARNPFGRGNAGGRPNPYQDVAPNFQRAHVPLGDKIDVEPVGFGVVSRHAQPRLAHAGTYDDRWRKHRFPLLPEDFEPRYFNCAPLDQQLDLYPAGSKLRLFGFLPGGHAEFSLPRWCVPVEILQARQPPVSGMIRPDTILIELDEQRVSLVGRIKLIPNPNALAVQQIRVGTPSKSWLKAARTGKTYFGRGGEW